MFLGDFVCDDYNAYVVVVLGHICCCHVASDHGDNLSLGKLLVMCCAGLAENG